jgi:hypothetical protein
MADHTRTALVTDAPQMALARRRPGLIGHSDQGSPFVSPASGRQARAAGIAQSMGARGDRFDNAVAESLLATPNKSSSTAAPGRPRPSCAPRSSSTSRPSLTATDDTRRSGMLSPDRSRQRARTTMRRSSQQPSPPRNPFPPNRGNSRAPPSAWCSNCSRPPRNAGGASTARARRRRPGRRHLHKRKLGSPPSTQQRPRKRSLPDVWPR